MESLNNDLESNNRKIDEIEGSISKALLYNDNNKKNENICNKLIPQILILLGISVIVIVIAIIL
jgi:hypothetical protein